MQPQITSRRNPKVVRWRAWVRESAARRESEWVLLEGEHLVAAALAAGVTLREVWVAVAVAERWAALLGRLSAVGVPVVPVARAVLEAVCDTETPQGIVAEAVKPRWSGLRARGDLVILDGVQEPGNVGAVLRVAAAAGAAGVWLTPGSAQAWSPKTLRAAMGAHFVVPIGEGEVPASLWQPFAQTGRLFAAAGEAVATSLYRLALREPVAWVLGSEGQGVSADWRERANRLVRIPIDPAVESLNVSTAAAVLLFEAVRQRQEGRAVRARQERHAVPRRSGA